MSKDLANILEELKLQKQETKIDPSIIKLISNRNDYNHLHPQIALQILRISAPKKILPKKEILKCFNNLHTLQKETLIFCLDTILTYKIMYLLDPSDFIKFYQTFFTQINEIILNYLIRVVLLYIEEKGKTEIFDFLKKNLKHILVKRTIVNKPFITMIENLDDDQEFCKLYFEVEKKDREKIDIRHINGKVLKRKYITHLLSDPKKVKRNSVEKENLKNTTNSKSDSSMRSSITNYIANSSDEGIASLSCERFKRLYELYRDDDHAKFLLIHRRKCCCDCTEILNELSNDDDYKIRAKAINYADFDIEKILDVSKEVRKVVFSIILNDKYKDENVLLTLFKGCMTKYKNEYIDVLRQIDIDFEFLFNNRKAMGVKVYLKRILNQQKENTIKENDIKNYTLNKVDNKITEINMDDLNTEKKKRFCFKYFSNITLDNENIIELAKTDLYSLYLYLKTKNIYNDDYNYLIHNNLDTVQNIKHYKRIIIFLSDYIKKNHIFDKTKLIKEKDFIYAAAFDYIPKDEIHDLITKNEPNFYICYFLAKHSKEDNQALNFIKEFNENDIYELIEIIIQSNNKDLFHFHFKTIFNTKLNEKIAKIIQENMNSISIMIYFFCGGNMNIHSESFFVESILRVSLGLNELNNEILAKIKTIYINFIHSLNRLQINTFYSLACKMKGMSICEENINYKIVDGKIDIQDIPLCDKILYTICDVVKKNIKNAKNVDNDFGYLQHHFNELDPLHAKLLSKMDFI